MHERFSNCSLDLDSVPGSYVDNENEFVDWLSEYGRLQYNESFDCLRSLYGVHDANYKIEVKFLMSLTTPAAYIVLGFWVRDY